MKTIPILQDYRIIRKWLYIKHYSTLWKLNIVINETKWTVMSRNHLNVQNSVVNNSRIVIKFFNDIWELNLTIVKYFATGWIHSSNTLSFFFTLSFLSFILRQVYPKLSKIFDVATGKLSVTVETRCPTVKEQVPGGIEEAAKSACTC